jgi:hypothetical protein
MNRNLIVVCIGTFLMSAGLLTSIYTIMVNASPDFGSGNNNTVSNLTVVGPPQVIKLKPTGNGSFTFSLAPPKITQPKNKSNLTVVGPPQVIKLKPTGNRSFTFSLAPPKITPPKLR